MTPAFTAPPAAAVPARTAARPAGVLAAAWAQVRSLVPSGVSRLREGDRAAWLLMAAWAAATILDAASTLVMGSLGFVEANPAAAWVMAAVGVPLAVALLSAWCLLLGVASCGRSGGRYGALVRAGLLLVLLLKLTVGVVNVTLAVTGVDLLVWVPRA